jgi:hypothetical protein
MNELDYNAPFEDGTAARRAILAGNAKVTLRGYKERFTYQIRKADDKNLWWVSLLTGPDNGRNFTYCGYIYRGVFKTEGEVKISPDAPGVVAFNWAWPRLRREYIPEGLEVWHGTECCACGRQLTVPASIGRGIGPVCFENFMEKRR